MIKGRFFQIAAAFLTLAPAALAQRYPDWRIFRAADGMAESPCVSVTAGLNDKVLTKHINSDSISELNGYSITTFTSPEVGRNRVYGSPGGQLWTVTSTGVGEFVEGAWKVHPIPQIAKLNNSVAPLVAPLVPIQVVRQGRVLVLLPDQLLLLNAEDIAGPKLSVLQSASGTGLQKFIGMTVARDGTLWISGAHGLEHSASSVRNFKPEDAWREFAAPPEVRAENFEAPLQDLDGDGLTFLADLPNEQRGIVHFDNGNWTVQSMENQRIRGAWRGIDGVTWAVSQTKVLQIDNLGTAPAEIEEVFVGHYFDVAVQTNGIFWLASAEAPAALQQPAALEKLRAHCKR